MHAPFRLTAAIAVVLALGAASPERASAAPAVDIAGLTDAIIKRHVLPRYEVFSRAADSLRAVVADRCGRDGLAAMREAYAAANDAWMSVQHIRFGPVMREDRHVRIEYWPDKHNQLSRQLARLLAAGDRESLEPARFARATVALQGFPAMERLLFAGDAADVLVRGSFRCALAGAIAANLATIAAETLAQWRDVEGGPDVADGLVDGLMTQLQLVGDLKLLRPLGATIAKARPRSAESWRSGRSARNVRLNVEALADLYSGGEGADLRTATAPADDGKGILEALDDGFAVAVRTARRLGDDLGADIRDERRRRTVRFLGVHLSGLREEVAKAVAPAMGVSLGFNSLDGD